MDKRTLTALEASIAHWEANVAAETPWDASLGVISCALCREFYGNYCMGCPVAGVTNLVHCQKTPYDRAVTAFDDWQDGKGTRDEWRKAAQAELDFLISLRPSAQEADQ